MYGTLRSTSHATEDAFLNRVDILMRHGKWVPEDKDECPADSGKRQDCHGNNRNKTPFRYPV